MATDDLPVCYTLSLQEFTEPELGSMTNYTDRREEGQDRRLQAACRGDLAWEKKRGVVPAPGTQQPAWASWGSSVGACGGCGAEQQICPRAERGFKET